MPFSALPQGVNVERVAELTPKLKGLWQAGIGQRILRFCPLHHGPPRFAQSVRDRQRGESERSAPSVICALG